MQVYGDKKEMTKDGMGYTYRTMWVLIAVWTIVSVWAWYIAYEHLNWNGNLWFALFITYIVILFPIIAFSNIRFEGF